VVLDLMGDFLGLLFDLGNVGLGNLLLALLY
jgi:hypothetical protein